MVSPVKHCTGVIAAFNPADYYSFTVVGTRVVTLELGALYGSPILYLYDASGDEIGRTNADPKLLNSGPLTEVLSSGTYYAEITDPTTAPYSLAISAGAPAVGSAPSSTQPTSLGALDDTQVDVPGYVGGSITDQAYTFVVAMPSELSIMLSGLQDSAGVSLVGLTGAGRLPYTPVADFWPDATHDVDTTEILNPGTYQVDVFVADSVDTGYNLALAATLLPVSGGATEATAQPLGTLTADPQVITGSVNSVNTSAYSFSVTSPERVSLSLSGVSQTTALVLYDATTGQLVPLGGPAAVVAAAPNNNSYATYEVQPPADGTYYIQVAGNSAETNFVLTAQATVLSANTSVATATR